DYPTYRTVVGLFPATVKPLASHRVFD
ncbi:MAG: hypothetical protein QOI90_2319, partial [Mycobacterium sp.]|nr:hypothetical protein [Mycobacterium sp.]